MQETKHWSAWIEAVRHAVGGASSGASSDPLARLMQVSEDGLKWAPLQAPQSVVASSPLSPHGAPHGAPQGCGWRMAQHAGDSLGGGGKGSIYDEIAGGADMVLIPRAMAMKPDDLAAVLKSAPDGEWGLGFHHGGDTNLALAEVWDDAKREMHFAGDPLGDLLGADLLLGDAGDVAARARALASWQKRHFSALPKARIFVASGDSAHSFGLSEIQELAWTLANLLWQLRALEAAGLTLAEACARLVMRVAVGADFYGALAKTRAVRFLLARFVAALDVGAAHTPLLHVITSERMLTRIEPMNNLLRHTTASLGGALGGADLLTTLPHDWLVGSTAQSRRLARGVQLIMRHEARLGEVADPAYGADTLEVMSQDIAKTAWQKFQEIEKAGGALAVLESGQLAAWAEAAIERRQQEMDAGAMPPMPRILGVNYQSLAPTQNLPPVVMEGGRVRGGQARLGAVWEDLCVAASAKVLRALLVVAGGAAEAQWRASWRDELRVLGVEIAEIAPASQQELIDAIAAAKPHLVVGGVGDVGGVSIVPLASDGKVRRDIMRKMIEGAGV